jgi:uncharacterized surface protein with fasciclin (FAS1) repeats
MPFRADASLVSVEGNQPNRARSVAESALASSKDHMKILRLNIATLVASFTAATVFATENPMVGGAPMLPKKNIIENASKSKDHTTLVAAVRAAGLVQTLEGKGPFTVLGPTNGAFEKLPAGTVEMLLKPENKEKLAGILTYHAVAGKLTADELAKEIKAGNGAAELKTANGEKLTAKMASDSIQLTDAKGGMSNVTIADVLQSNGVIHLVDKVLMP